MLTLTGLKHIFKHEFRAEFIIFKVYHPVSKAKYEQAVQVIEDRKTRRLQILRFAEELKKQDPIKEYDENLWYNLVRYVTVYGKDDIRVTFRDGTEVPGWRAYKTLTFNPWFQSLVCHL